MTEPQSSGPSSAQRTTPSVLSAPVVGPTKPVHRGPRHTWWIVLGVVVVLCCGGGVAGLLYFARAAANATAPVSQAADSFFSGLANGSDVYGQLCSDAKAAVSRQQFDQLRATRPLRGYAITGTYVDDVNGQTSATVTVQLRFDSGSETHLVPMASEGGAWRVCGRPY